MRHHSLRNLITNHCHIIGMCECQLLTEKTLNDGLVGLPQTTAVAESLADRVDKTNFRYMTIRPNEEATNLTGVRAEPGNDIQCLVWDTVIQPYTVKGRPRTAISRLLVAKVAVRRGINHIGTEVNAMVVHMHNDFANRKLRPSELPAWYDKLRGMLVRYEVKVVMGDFNMWLFRIIPEMRQRGLTVDLGAWLPWKGLPRGLSMADSTGIVMVNAPGQYNLVKNVRHLHTDPDGILSAVAGDDGFLHIEENAGPGQELRTYLPKQMSLG